VQVGAGQVIVRQGAPADKFFIIVDGSVEVVHEDGERTLTVLRGGEFFGEIAILRDSPRTATVRALTPTSLLAMDRDTFRGLVAQALGTTQDFGAVIQERLDRSRQVNQP
jgi:CRP-like cAMP-binding protein